ncbi:RsmB/NOP family class I SAM-dependent RNA methyltransferase [Sphingomonas colocasiae]|uniref:RsmB/NOP family class I SAM-dependent RNA methyltransferase n=1 Tax=Sphingomonas colocasiae TaxID=1848973 RepID=A0ABS7PJ50_9SPHN|nr:RsmB/NOP family class I SAM-dependent RNA methyltransferase [Sphingomonas colocasiae]MBY8821319.1 RsmB/NOP family class I SAM-dependent RNA methyltransferase [Sphingomonas colocasiae]
MTPQARVQAAIDLLDEIVAAAREGGAAADTLIARYFKSRRYAGSKDRRAVRDLVYAAIRRSGERPETGRAAVLGVADHALFDGSPHGPAPIGRDEPMSGATPVPGWLVDRLAVSDPAELAALLERAPLDLRVNRLKSNREAVLAALPEAVATDRAPDGIRLPEGFAVEAHPLWQAGAVEVQDEGSQLIALACRASPGMTVIDLCAGAGGKTLALAADMEERGRLIACDVVKARLDRLMPRAERAGAGEIESRLLDGGREGAALADLVGQADVVLVDAPCSGSGTWRRNPEARWRLTPQRLDAITALQARIVDLAVPLLKPGGSLVYAVCSLIDAEGRDQVASALSRHSCLTAETPIPHVGRMRGDGVMLTPARDRTDGFFVARLRRADQP